MNVRARIKSGDLAGKEGEIAGVFLAPVAVPQLVGGELRQQQSLQPFFVVALRDPGVFAVGPVGDMEPVFPGDKGKKGKR